VADWIAASAAAAALVLSLIIWQRQRSLEATSYLILSLILTRVDSARLIASTSLENRSAAPKRLDTIFLLVGPMDEAPTETFNQVLAAHGQPLVADIGEFGRATAGLAARCAAGARQYMRLDYYSAENSEVGDEVLTYEAVLNARSFHPGSAYSVRLFLYGPGRLHRVVHRALVG
jgi:hypothetical protein